MAISAFMKSASASIKKFLPKATETVSQKASNISSTVGNIYKHKRGITNILKTGVGGVAGIGLGTVGAAAGLGPIGMGAAFTGGLVSPFVAPKLGMSAINFAINHPRTTFGLGLAGVSAYSFAKPFVAKNIIDQQNRPTNPALGYQNVGPGYVTLGNSPRINMRHNNLGATGDLTLSLHKNRKNGSFKR